MIGSTEAHRHGAKAAVKAFYDRYAGPSMTYVRKVTRDPDSAQDIIQEVFVADLDPGYGIAIHSCDL